MNEKRFRFPWTFVVCLLLSRVCFAAEMVADPEEVSREAFPISMRGQGEITVADANGAMYGGLGVADRLRLGLTIEAGAHEPFIKKRAIKFNIPLDARSPSYDSSGRTKLLWKSPPRNRPREFCILNRPRMNP